MAETAHQDVAGVVERLRNPGIRGKLQSIMELRLEAATLIESLSKALSEADAERDMASRAFAFVSWAMVDGPWQGCDLDGLAVQEKAQELGLLTKTKYDPETHGESEFDCEPGDEWFVLNPTIAARRFLNAGKE